MFTLGRFVATLLFDPAVFVLAGQNSPIPQILHEMTVESRRGCNELALGCVSEVSLLYDRGCVCGCLHLLRIFVQSPYIHRLLPYRLPK